MSARNELQFDEPTGDEPKARYECPAGHKSWERINDHAWCHACSRDCAANDDADPEWYDLVDTRTGERVAFAELKDDWPDFREVPAY